MHENAWDRLKVVFLGCAMAFAMTTKAQDANDDLLETHRYQLANGVEVLHMYAPNAKRQTTFTFLPQHFLVEPTDRAQWSHLMEHMMIRSTDPVGIEIEGMTFNGETSHESLRLETIAEPHHWRASIEKHARWLSFTEIDAEVLNREKTNIAMEEQTTTANKATHKFAMAAWNQIVQNGSDHAAVHGDVANATVADTNDYLQSRLAIDDTVLVATIGPIASEQVKKDLEATIGQLPTRHANGVAKSQVDRPDAGVITATWDLPTRHFIVWWDIPADGNSTSTKAAAAVLTAGGMMGFFQRPPTGLQAGQVLMMSRHADESCTVFVNGCIDQDTDVDAVVANVRERIATMAGAKSQLQFFAKSLAAQYETVPDFDSQRMMVPEAYRPMIEAQWFLQTADQQFRWKMPTTEVAEAFRSIDEAAWTLIKERFASEPSGILLLEPNDRDE